MIHKAKQNRVGYVGMIRPFVARSSGVAHHPFPVEGYDLTVFVFNDRLVVVGKPYVLSGSSQYTVDFGDSAVMMSNAHRSRAPRGTEALRGYLRAKNRRFPFEEIELFRIQSHSVQAVRPATGAKRNGTGVLISYGGAELTLVGRADHVRTLGDWLDAIRRQ